MLSGIVVLAVLHSGTNSWAGAEVVRDSTESVGIIFMLDDNKGRSIMFVPAHPKRVGRKVYEVVWYNLDARTTMLYKGKPVSWDTMKGVWRELHPRMKAKLKLTRNHVYEIVIHSP